MKYITPVRVLCALVFVAALSSQSVAQTPTPSAAPTPEFLSVTVVSVKPDMVTEFQNFMKTLLILH